SVRTEEPLLVGCKSHPDFDRCFSTSYSWGQKLTSIDLVEEGVPEWILDRIRARIVVSEWVAPRFDCASKYQMYAQLMREGEKFGRTPRLPHYKVVKKEWPQPTNPAEWERVEMVFDEYPMGMREIGVLSQEKGEHHTYRGSNFANLQIRIEMPDKFRWLSEADIPDGEMA
ncbi:hypothetical protein PENTCL1PPCAC_26013, partial [Pristionchus entomophagus]